MHVHFRQPGRQEYKETIRTGSRAAVRGGFTTVACEPNTDPPIDTPKRVEYILDIAQNESLANLYTKAAITVGMKGNKVTDILGLVRKHAIAITDDGFPVKNIDIMSEAAKKAKKCGIPICPHCEESRLAGRRETYTFEHFNSEAKYVQNYLHIVRDTACWFHFPHVSLADSVEHIAEAKKEGLPVSAEATPHHFTLTKEDYKRIGPNAKVNPPLRSKEDVAALRDAISSNVIDVIASDHAPHAPHEKLSANPPFGIIGLETLLGVVLTELVHTNKISLLSAIEKMTANPARILHIRRGDLRVGMPADITIIDVNREWVVDVDEFESKGRNCPFDGRKLRGKATMTIVGGKVAMCDGTIFDPPAADPHLWLPESRPQLRLPI